MRYMIGLLMAAIILSGIPSYAHTRGKVDVEITTDGGGAFSAIPFRDYLEGKTRVIKRYLEARKGENYSIILRNNMPERVGVVLAVDGRNIITGKKSSLRNVERMYILEPYGYAKLDGWRTDDNTVNAFYFTNIGDSYAVRTFSDSSAMGVIAAAVFREKDAPMVYEQEMKKERSPAPSAGRSAQGSVERYDSGRPGTGFGDSRYSPVTKVKFDPEAVPIEKVLVKYEWREVLCSKGLIKCLPEKRNRLWDEDEYAPYPPGFNGR